MDPKIKCLKCGSYIHDTDRCVHCYCEDVVNNKC